MLKRRRFRYGAEAAGDEFGGVVERAQALARLQDEHASERPAPVYRHGGLARQSAPPGPANEVQLAAQLVAEQPL